MDGMLDFYQENAFCGCVYVPEIDDIWYFDCVVEDDIYDFTWKTNGWDPCWVCKIIIDIRCNGYSENCSHIDIIEALTEEFETKIMNKLKGRKND